MDAINQHFISVWKPIRNQLSQYWSEQIFVETMKQLNKCWGKSILEIHNERLANPWHCLLILKWGLVYGAFHRRDVKKPFGEREWESIFSRVMELPAQLQMLNKDSSTSLWRFMRASFSSQFYYQQETGLYGLAVLETILKDIKINYSTSERLKSFTGLALEDFVEMQLLIGGGIALQLKPQMFNAGFFKRFRKNQSEEQIKTFLDFCSLDFPNLTKFLIEDHRSIKNPEFEFSLFSSLYKKPFFKHGGMYQAYHPTPVKHFIEFGIYDILKANDAVNFSQHFGVGFEIYVGIPLKNLGYRIFSEGDLKKELHEESVPDYGMVINEDALLIEVKSAEMRPLTLQNPEEIFLRRTLENSVIKGYKQLFSAARRIKQGNAGKLVCTGKIYGIIVTFKQLFLGQPISIWNEFMEKIIRESFPPEVLSEGNVLPENIFCLSIFEFDSLCAYSLEKGISITECLKIAVENNKAPESASFMFSSHLKSSNVTIRSFPHVIGKFDEIMGRLRIIYQAEEEERAQR